MIKILITEDMQMLRESLKFMVESDNDMHVIALAQDGNEAIELCHKETPDVVIMDLKMPGLDGFEATSAIKAKYPDIKVIALSTFNDEESVSKAVKSGVDGFITKDLGLVELHQSIKAVHLGLRIFQNIPRSKASKKIYQGNENDQQKIDLTDRDIEVIKHIADGKSYKEIGHEVHLSEGTVRNMVYNLLGRLDFNDRIQLAVFAVKNKLI